MGIRYVTNQGKRAPAFRWPSQVPMNKISNYPVPQNALVVSAEMNVLKFPRGKP